MSSLYGQYIKERENAEIVENEYGFINYRINKDNTCFIQDLFVHPEYRHNRVARELADKLVEIVKEKGVNTLYCSVIPSANHSTSSIKAIFTYGFEIDSSTNNFILLKRSI